MKGETYEITVHHAKKDRFYRSGHDYGYKARVARDFQMNGSRFLILRWGGERETGSVLASGNYPVYYTLVRVLGEEGKSVGGSKSFFTVKEVADVEVQDRRWQQALGELQRKAVSGGD